jgi:predicted regulator of Ras-like GTPase activity (Roadblock/LC7/MglB family)
VPFRDLLEGLVRGVDGAQGVVMMDASGEVVFEAGDGQERHRLIGAYQGIALVRIRSAEESCGTGAVRHVHCRYSGGQVVLRPLKDGYYLVMSLAPHANLGQALFRSAEAQSRLDQEL